MRTVGIVGGLGPEATIDYYRLIIERYQSKCPHQGYPRILINSIDMAGVLRMLGLDGLCELEDLLCDAIERLARAGAEFAVIASNTPHLVFPAVRRRSSIPLISIVDVACAASQRMHLRRLGLIGSRFTMQKQFYRDVFTPAGIALVVPTKQEQEFIHDKYMTELVKAIIKPETREAFVGIAKRMMADERIDGLILGGTELPLIFRQVADIGIPFLDTTELHVDAIVESIVAGTRNEAYPGASL